MGLENLGRRAAGIKGCWGLLSRGLQLGVFICLSCLGPHNPCILSSCVSGSLLKHCPCSEFFGGGGTPGWVVSVQENSAHFRTLPAPLLVEREKWLSLPAPVCPFTAVGSTRTSCSERAISLGTKHAPSVNTSAGCH